MKRVGSRNEAGLVCCAEEFELGFWDGLEAAGVAGRVLPVPIPRDAAALGNPLEAPPRLLPRAYVASSAGGKTVRVTLAGYCAPALIDVLAGKQTDARAGLDAVDLWAVDPDWHSGTPFQAAWFAGRPSHFRWREPELVPLVSPELKCAPQGCLLVKVWDGLGRAASAGISPSAPSRVHAATRKKVRGSGS
jgi:hypothetical protein